MVETNKHSNSLIYGGKEMEFLSGVGRTQRSITFFGVFMILVLFMAPVIGQAQPMIICPHKWILNAVGSAEDIQGIIRMPLDAGYSLGDYDVTLSIEGETIAQAISFVYCYIDDNFIASFDKAEVWADPVVLQYAGSEVLATVEGWFIEVADDGSTITRTFTRSATIEILAPGKNN
jgi:hypothetical protein